MKSTHTRTSKPNNINLYGDAVKTVYFSIYQLQKSNVVKNKNRLSSNLRVLVSKWHIFCFLSNFFHSTPHIHTGETPRLDSSAFTNLHTAKARTIELWWDELVDFTAAEWRQDLLRDSGITMRLVHSLIQERTVRLDSREHTLIEVSQNRQIAAQPEHQERMNWSTFNQTNDQSNGFRWELKRDGAHDISN